jgi:hypothetical protein
MYLDGWKEALPFNEVHGKDFLPVDKVQVPRRLEGNPSSQRVTCTSPAGRIVQVRILVSHRDAKEYPF